MFTDRLDRMDQIIDALTGIAKMSCDEQIKQGMISALVKELTIAEVMAIAIMDQSGSLEELNYAEAQLSILEAVYEAAGIDLAQKASDLEKKASSSEQFQKDMADVQSDLRELGRVVRRVVPKLKTLGEER